MNSRTHQNGSSDCLVQALTLLRQQEKCCLFIDNSNLFHVLKAMNLENKRLDYIKLKDKLSAGRSVNVRFYYSMPSIFSDGEIKRERRNKFYDFLENNLGFTMIELPLRERTVMENGILISIPTEKGLDCEIVYDMAILSRYGNYNTFIIVTGDEDYARTIKKIRNETGISIEVAFFEGSSCSHKLIKEASKFINLNDLKDELFRDYKKDCDQCLVVR